MSSFSDPIVWPTAPSSSSATTSSSGARAATTKRTTTKKSRESDTILMVEESLLGEDWTTALSTNFLSMDEPMTSSSVSSSSSAAAAAASSSGGRPAQGNTTIDRRLRFKTLITPFAGLFQWLKVPPNANHTDWIYNQHLPHLYNMHAILGNGEEFCRLALESTDDVSFPSLDKWIERLLDRLRQYSFRPKDGEKPRVVLILSDIDKQVTKLQKKIAKDPQQASKVAAEIVDGACTHVLLMYDVEIFRCKGIADVSDYLHTMTRALESQLERPLTAFNCVSKATKLKVGDELTGQQKENFMMNQTWMAMLQMIPHMSKDRASAAASNPQFSSLKRVYDAMNDQTKTKKERKLLMESAFGGKRDRDGNVRGKNPKLSKLVYRLMTEHDPEKSIGYESEEEANEPKSSNNGTSGADGEKPKTNGRKRTKKTVTEPSASVAEVISISETLETQIDINYAESMNFLIYDDSCPFYEDGEDSNAVGDW